MTLDKKHYSACETDGRIDVTVRRRGAAGSHVTVGVRAKPLSARQGVDFNERSPDVIEFQPGLHLNERIAYTIALTAAYVVSYELIKVSHGLRNANSWFSTNYWTLI